MIIVENKTLERINDWEDSTIYILTDFDRTITRGDSNSSWGILSKTDLMSDGYVKERIQLYNYYRPIEIDETLDYETKNKLMIEWWNKHIGLFVKYKLSEDVVNNAARSVDVMSFRDGAKEFLENMKERNIPVIIISAGIGNFIEQFLIKNECYFENVYIVSNFIKFENKIAVGISDMIIHSLNKNEVALTGEIKELIKDRNNIILLGDSLSDVKMVSEDKKDDALKISFLDEKIEDNLPYFKEQFDIVCTNNTSYNELVKKIKLFK